ncbi:MAG TPA: DUF1385 domain-containing protein [Fimbriimonadaceae bacterium]|nr:DUF1385 domain-containing protein [Fimbriimonadaceae bacterium]
MDHLDQPLGLLMRPTFSVDLKDSLELAARKLRENGCDTLPVTDDGFLAGAVSESDLAQALSNGTDMTVAVETISHGALTGSVTATGADALRLFNNQDAKTLIVIDDAGQVQGIVTPSDLYPKRLTPLRPHLVGGMATPFGVYLTTGSLRAGVSHLALITTGITLLGLLQVGGILGVVLHDVLRARHVDASVADIAEPIATFGLFLLGMRLIPLSGIHAAEHKVVHAIERGEELVPSIVRRMPRVHPRCGTNLAVGASLFMGVGGIPIFHDPGLRFLLAGIVTLIFWRPLGNLMQYYVTTKRPTDKHLAMGIRSGRELLQKYATSSVHSAGFWVRILNSGIFHVAIGSSIATGLLYLAMRAVGLSAEHYMWEVY